VVAFTATAAWNLATWIVCLMLFAYSFSYYRKFKGGKLGRVGVYAVAISGELSIAFFLSFIFNLEGVSVINLYGISIKDLGLLIAMVFGVLALRETNLFWNPQTAMSR